MLGVTINYHQIEQLFLKELHVEWIHRPFLDVTIHQYLDKAKREGRVELFGEVYNTEDIETLSNETEGRLFEVKFSPGPCEGYSLILKMESGQIFNIKTFDRNLLDHFLSWIHRLEASNRDKPHRQINDFIPVGSIVYVVDRSSAGIVILPHKVERRDPSHENSFPLCLKNVNSGSQEIRYLDHGWEKSTDIFVRIEDAIAYTESK